MQALSSPWISAALAAGAAYYVATKMPEKLGMVPQQIRQPHMLALTSAVAVLGIQKFFMNREIGSPVQAISDVVTGTDSTIPVFPPRGLLGAEQFYGN